MFFKNIFFDTSQIDIDSEVNLDHQRYLKSQDKDSSIKRNKSIERSINRSLEKSEARQKSQYPRFQSPSSNQESINSISIRNQ